MMMEIGEEDLRAIVELAESKAVPDYEQFGAEPTKEEKAVLYRVWRILGKPIPEFFRRNFGWKGCGE